MSAGRCPSPADRARAIAGDSATLTAAVLAHAEACPRCGLAIDDDRAVVAVLRAAPGPAPLDDRRRARLAAELMARADAAEAADARPVLARRPARFALAAALLLAAAGAIAWRAGLSGSRTPGAALSSPTAAQVEPPRAPSSPVPVEPPAPVLRDGRLELGGDGAGARPARVRVGDVEVAATTDERVTRFAAVAADDVIVSVQVFAGTVELRRPDAAVIVIHAGEIWRADDIAAPVAVTVTDAEPVAVTVTDAEPVAEPAPRPSRRPAAERRDTAPSTAAAFQQGWADLHAGRFAAAARTLDTVAAAAGPDLAEDARYWAAIAWGRAGDPARARAGLARFLQRHPRSPLAGAAHLALGTLLLDLDRAAALEHLTAAARDPNPRIQRAAAAARAR